MLIERIEAKWVELFADVFRQCAVQQGDTVAILAETQSRPVLVELADLAAQRLGARSFRLIVPTPALPGAIPIRSTGASSALQRLGPAIDALKGSTFVVDLTVEGLLHAEELPAILGGGARVLMVSNEHPEILERTKPDPALESRVRAGMRMLKSAGTMKVTSTAGTDLTVQLAGARVGGGWGFTAKPGTITHWPGGLCLAFPAAGAVNGTLVMQAGDVNLTFKQYVRDAIRLTIVDDFITAIDGIGVDVDMMRGYLSAWNETDAYAVSHVGWGMNPAARWDALAFYDKRDCNGTELRAFAGNFLYSTGANEVAGRRTLGHFDLPLRRCTIALDDRIVVNEGSLQGELV